jgi:hypothetical protein
LSVSIVMRLLLSSLTLLAVLAAAAGPVSACEKHLKGHQNSAEIQTDASGR